MAWLAGFRGQHVAVSNASGQNSEAPTSPIASALFKYAPLNEVVLSAPAGMNRQQAEEISWPTLHDISFSGYSSIALQLRIIDCHWFVSACR